MNISADYLISDTEETSIIASRSGNITIIVNDEMKLNAILYAPNGKVTIQGSGMINGRVFAKEIQIDSDTVIISGGSEYISAMGFIPPEPSEAETTESTSDETTEASGDMTDETAESTEAMESNTSETDVGGTQTTEDITEETTTEVKPTGTAFTEAEYSYDGLGRLIKVTYDTENYIEYEYDANGNITNVKKYSDGVLQE